MRATRAAILLVPATAPAAAAAAAARATAQKTAATTETTPPAPAPTSSSTATKQKKKPKKKKKAPPAAAAPPLAHFQPGEVATARTVLLSWYHRHRRRLPWRGDVAPFTGVPDVFASMEAEASSSSSSASVSASPPPHSPHRNPANPYASWVSEIMLQQTRVDTVVGYHTRWMARFPTVQALAAASEDDVNKLWSGLGYYRRARLLHKGAKYVVSELNGALPHTIEGLKQIPGIGPYTAGAIASIAFGVNTPVVDGNVIRVLSRLRALAGSPKSASLVAACWEIATRLNDPEQPGDFNQALMELGATVCSPKAPRCDVCPARSVCRARSEASGVPIADVASDHVWHSSPPSVSSSSSSSSSVSSSVSRRPHIVIDYAADADERAAARVPATSPTKYPFAAKKKPPRLETWAVTVVESAGRFLLLKRPSSGLLAGQWEFPSVQLKIEADAGAGAGAGAGAEAAEGDGRRRRTQVVDGFLERLLSSARSARRDLGPKVHVFSHIKHTMLVDHLVLTPADGDGVGDSDPLPHVSHDREHRWAARAQLEAANRKAEDSVPLTTGMRKVFAMLGAKAAKKRKKATGSAAAAAAVKTRSISSFFTKKKQKKDSTTAAGAAASAPAASAAANLQVSSYFNGSNSSRGSSSSSSNTPSIPGAGAFKGCTFHPVCPVLTADNFYVRDFTKGLVGEAKPSGHAALPYSIGRYNERRSSMYTSELFAGSGSSDDTWSAGALADSVSADERRDIHIGVDVMGPVNTPVHAVANGTIHAVGYNPAALDYGNVIVTKHEANGITFWALLGHLSGKSIEGKAVGDKVARGQLLGWFGDTHENGGWPPHVHFQLSLIEPPTHDMPGVVSTSQHAQALKDYPDPRWVMGPVFPGEGLFQ